MNRLGLYVRTMRYVRPSQIAGRLGYLIRRRTAHPLRIYRRSYARMATGHEPFEPIRFRHFRTEHFACEELHAGTFTFLNRKVSLGRPRCWLPASETKLWQYNLHYFHYAVALAKQYLNSGDTRHYDCVRALVHDWIENCPVAEPIAWDPYPTSLRIGNWIKIHTLFAPLLEADPEFASTLRRSIYIQTCFLARHIEYPLRNNHVLENGRALLLAGLFFRDARAPRWRNQGLEILLTGLADNVLGDGGHDELSPMYHQAMLELYEEAAQVLRAGGHPVPGAFAKKLAGMRNWLSALTHPDGEIALLNDSAIAILNPAGEILPTHERTGDGFLALPDSGYFTFRDRSRGNYLVFDCGTLGPDHHPGHGHCDALSYELSLAGQRIIVDSGVGTYYGAPDWRHYYRSTRAHNTVVVDGAEQSEIWHRFRVARRAWPGKTVWSESDADCLFVTGSHSGYLRLPGRVLHQRWICWINRTFWAVCDRVSGRGAHRLENLIHLHPEVGIERSPAASASSGVGAARVRRGNATLQIVPWGAQHAVEYFGQTAPIQGWYAPQFGLPLKNRTWNLVHTGQLPVWMGYLLWPDSEPVSVSATAEDASHCQIEVESRGLCCTIRFGNEGVVARHAESGRPSGAAGEALPL